jgi:hypothetical protein
MRQQGRERRRNTPPTAGRGQLPSWPRADGRSDEGARQGPDECPARRKARAKDRTNARQDDPAETGGNPKAPPKSGFPFAASIENVLSGDENARGRPPGQRGRGRGTQLPRPAVRGVGGQNPWRNRHTRKRGPLCRHGVPSRRWRLCPTREHIQPPGRRPPSAESAVHGVVCPNP